MCTSLFLWDQHPTLLFFLAFNRDEFLSRQTHPAHFWQDAPSLLAGRDGERGGTWLGITTGGRFAMLTNFREVAYDQIKDAPSRGALTTQFLLGSSQPLQYLRGLKAEAYNGFNLVVGDFKTQKMAYFSNRQGQQPRELNPGLYGISNGVLDSNWPKVERGKTRLETMLSSRPDLEQTSPTTVFDEVMNEQSKVYKADQLPDTGLPIEVEQLMSSIFIQPCNLRGAGYGTRSQTLLIVHRNGSVQLHERSRPAQQTESDIGEDVVWTEVQKDFQLAAEQNHNLSDEQQTCKS